MSSKNKNNVQQDTVGMVRSALVGKVPALRELEKKLGLKEFERRCAGFLEVVFEPKAAGKSVTAEDLKAKARAHVEKSQEMYRHCCEEFYKALDCLFTLSVRVEGTGTLPKAEADRVAKSVNPPNPDVPAKKPSKGALASDQKADKAKLDAAVERHIAENRPQRHTRLPASVRLTPHEIALNIGSFMTKELAQRDAAELLSFARAIWNRSTVFPSPSRYGVQPHVEAAQPVKRSDHKFTAPWTVNVTIAISGDDRKCASWGENVYARNRGEQE